MKSSYLLVNPWFWQTHSSISRQSFFSLAVTSFSIDWVIRRASAALCVNNRSQCNYYVIHAGAWFITFTSENSRTNRRKSAEISRNRTASSSWIWCWSFVVMTPFVRPSDSAALQNSSFSIQNSSFSIHNSSFSLQNSWFLLTPLPAPRPVVL